MLSFAKLRWKLAVESGFLASHSTRAAEQFALSKCLACDSGGVMRRTSASGMHMHGAMTAQNKPRPPVRPCDIIDVDTLSKHSSINRGTPMTSSCHINSILASP